MVSIKQVNKTISIASPCKVCNMDYLVNVTRGNEKIINSLVGVFFTETKQELLLLNTAIQKKDFRLISDIAHKLKSAFSILGISVLDPVFAEMELLSSNSSAIEKIILPIRRIHIVFNQARAEMKAAQ